MSTHKFKQVDVFTSVPLKGNPVAVVFDADGLSDKEMQSIAAWTNLSETTFFRKASPGNGADYQLRIFYPKGELPFAGHPTVGSAHAAIEGGIIPAGKREFVMECGAGLLPLRVEGDGPERRVFVRAPEAEFVHEFGTSVEAIAAVLGAPVAADPPPASINNGPVWLFCGMASSDIARLTPDMTAAARLSRDLSVSGFAPFALVDGADHQVHIRVFAPDGGVPEDPVTGSANASLPTYLLKYGLIEKSGRAYTSSQGTELGRDGRVHVRVLDDDRVEIGGHAVTVIDGEIRL
ncbi:MAG: PhzF family phenazine biosynthesis protein [Dehalococcoidia bacterium]